MAETNVQQRVKPMKMLKVKLSQASNYFLGLLLIYFLFFGYIANCGTEYIQNIDPRNRILFVYLNFYNTTNRFNPLGLNIPTFLNFIFRIPAFMSIFILFAIGIYQSYREDFVVYGIKNNIWMVPSIIFVSWFWTAFNARESIFTTIARYFSSYQGYVNIIVLLVLYTAAGLIGTYLKCKTNEKEQLIKSRSEMADEELQEEAF